MNTKVLSGLVLVVAVGGFGFFKYTQIDGQIMNQNISQISLQNTNPNTNQNASQASSQVLNQVSNSSENTFDSNIVNTHNQIGDCWVTFDKKIYDITAYATKHPGGIRSVARYCGKSLDAISDSHNGGSFGSAGMQNILKKYLIGSLK